MKKSVIIVGCAVVAIVAATLKFAPQVSNGPTVGSAVEQLPDSPIGSPVATGQEAIVATRGLSPAQAQRRESSVSNTEQAQPPQTYVGPDGKEHAIVYNQGLNLDAQEVRQMKAEIIKDMRAHPDAFVGLYGLEISDVEAIVAGKQDLPKEMVAKLVM